jgi:hypothetical protein
VLRLLSARPKSRYTVDELADGSELRGRRKWPVTASNKSGVTVRGRVPHVTNNKKKQTCRSSAWPGHGCKIDAQLGSKRPTEVA